MRWGNATGMAAVRILGVVLLAAATNLVQAADIRVLAANAVREPFMEIAAAFEKATGHRVLATWSGTAGIVKRIDDGQVADIVIVVSDAVDRMVGNGRLRADGRVDFARSGIGIAVRPGIARPDISTPESVKAAILQARSVAYSSGPSGVYIESLFERMGIVYQVKGKLVRPPPSVQIGDLLPFKDIQFVGALPAAIQNTTVYRGALHPGAPAPEAAGALLKFLVAPESAPAIRRAGLEPG